VAAESAHTAADLRRRAVLTAALCAILGGFVPLGLHGHRWIAFLCIAAQTVLLATAVRLFALSNRAAANRRK
jgi:hypothetical protein